MQKKIIKNIIFDLGNVIINIDPDLSVKEMKKLGFQDFEKSYSLLNQEKLFDLLEKGLVTEEHFYQEIKSRLVSETSTKSIRNAWCAMLLDFPPERIKLIQSLKQNYRLFLLSNTNKIHFDKYNKNLIDQFGFGLNSLFEKAYYSFEAGLRKPGVKIYQYTLKNSNLKAEETLFIDDSYANIEAAKKTGLQTLWINIEEKDDIIEKLNGF